MPMAISFTPALAAVSITVWTEGMVLSPPSSPKRLVETYFFAQKASKPSASVRCSRISRLAALSKAVRPGGAFHPALDPGLLVGVLDMHELDADRAAIAGAADRHDLADGGGIQPQHAVDEDRPVPVGFGEAVGRRVEFRVRLRLLQAERVELRVQMAAHAVAADQHQRADANRAGRRGWRPGRGRAAGAGAPLPPFGAGGASGSGAKPPRGRGAQEAPDGIRQHRRRIIVQRAEQFGEGRDRRCRASRPSGRRGRRGRRHWRLSSRMARMSTPAICLSVPAKLRAGGLAASLHAAERRGPMGLRLR